ncbi:hypothetical protein R1flu_025154 [Riccia fluitans]|uniref:Uncharacterized protein n=1 Tax=Riccia fluitans TaxID=41844 RepID=A0ABD1XWX7_9MARC
MGTVLVLGTYRNVQSPCRFTPKFQGGTDDKVAGSEWNPWTHRRTTQGETGWKPLTQEGKIITKQGPGANETSRKQDKRPKKSPQKNDHTKGPGRNGLPGARAANVTPLPHKRTPSKSEPRIREWTMLAEVAKNQNRKTGPEPRNQGENPV